MECIKTVSIKAYAKLNLLLNVEGVQGDLHLIDSIVTPFNIFDTVKMTKREDEEIFVKYLDGTQFASDTAYKMAQLIKDEYRLGGVDIEITKNIPTKAGVGGSSADAGAVARGMEKLFALDKTPIELLLEVGSDVPYMYYGGDKRVQGVGQSVTAVKLPKLYKVLIVDGIGVDTKKSYENYDIYGGEYQDITTFITNLYNQCAVFTNALKKASIKLNSNIEKTINLLTECGFSVGMTGSGSGVFGIEYDKLLFESKLRKLIKKQPKLQYFIS